MRELLARPSGTVGGASIVGRTAEEEEASLMLMIDVEQRVANWTALPPNHLEGWQVCRCDHPLRRSKKSCKMKSNPVSRKKMLSEGGGGGEAAHRSQKYQAACGCVSGSISCTSRTAAAATTHSSSGLPALLYPVCLHTHVMTPIGANTCAVSCT